MDILIQLLIVVNITLGMALFVVKMALMDQRHAQRVREQTRVKSYFRTGQWDD
jgi:hypothetical protein